MLGLLVIFMLCAVVFGYIHKTGAERDAREIKLAAIQRKLAKIEKDEAATRALNQSSPKEE